MSFRVTIISGSYPPILDGVGDYTKCVFDQLTRLQGRENVELVTTGAEGHFDEANRVKRIIPSWSVGQMFRLAGFLRRSKPDVINIQLPALGYGRSIGPSVLPWLLRRSLPNARLVATLHEFTSRTLKGKLRLLASLCACDDVITVSEHYHDELKAFFPQIKCRFHYVPIGSLMFPQSISSDRFDRLRRSLALRPDSPTIAHFGVIRHGKGIEFMLNAFATVVRRYSHAKLLIIGGSNEKYLNEVTIPAMSRLGIRNNVEIVGKCSESELSHYFALSDLSVQPFEDGVSTRRSSFLAPLVHGLPIITTHPQHGFPGIADRHNALLVDYGNVDQLSKAMIELFLDRGLNDELRAGATALAQMFQWERIGERIIQVFQASLEPAKCS